MPNYMSHQEGGLIAAGYVLIADGYESAWRRPPAGAVPGTHGRASSPSSPTYEPLAETTERGPEPES